MMPVIRFLAGCPLQVSVVGTFRFHPVRTFGVLGLWNWVFQALKLTLPSRYIQFYWKKSDGILCRNEEKAYLCNAFETEGTGA